MASRHRASDNPVKEREGWNSAYSVKSCGITLYCSLCIYLPFGCLFADTMKCKPEIILINNDRINVWNAYYIFALFPEFPNPNICLVGKDVDKPVSGYAK